jgi:2,4-didehydro-3-deoxy-L-rhamnonate hydrolase
VRVGELDPSDLRLGMRLNGIAVQDGRTSQMRLSVAEILDYLDRHVRLESGDLIATGTPARIGPFAERHLEPGDVMTSWIEGIGELTTSVA